MSARTKIIGCMISLIAGFGCENRIVSQWITPRSIASNLNGSPEEVTVTTDGYGDLHVAWMRRDTSSFIAEDIYYTYRSNMLWTPVQNVSMTPSPSHAPVLCTDSHGRLHVFWREQIGIPPTPYRTRSTDLYWRMRTDSGWTAAVSVFHSDSAMTLPPPSIVPDIAGKLFLVGMNPSFLVAPEIQLMTLNRGVWSPPRFLRRGIYPSMTKDSAGILRIAYVRYLFDSSAIDLNSVFTTYSTDGGETWSDSILVSRSGLLQAFYPQILTDALGWHHIIWFKLTDPTHAIPRSIFHSRSRDGVVWETAVNVTQSVDALYTSFGCVADRYGRVHVVAKGDNDLYYYVFSNGAWSQAEHVPLGGTTTLSVALAISPSQVLHLVWSGGDSTTRGVFYSARNIALSAKDDQERLPKTYSLHPSFPNPFNPSTQMQFDLPEASSVSLNVFDVLGRKVASLVEGVREAGSHTAVWSAETFASGVYFARFVATNLRGDRRYLRVNKLLLAK